jgi:hypothetical protein
MRPARRRFAAVEVLAEHAVEVRNVHESSPARKPEHRSFGLVPSRPLAE